MSKYIIKVNQMGDDASGINVAFVDVTQGLINVIARARHLFVLAKKEDDSLYRMTFWNMDPEFFESENDEEDYLEGSMLVDDDFTYKAERVECVTMDVTEDGVRWTCYQKHCNVELCTDVLGYAVLEAEEGLDVKELKSPGVL